MRVEGAARSMTTAKALMVELTRHLERAGAEVVLLTTSPGIAAVFFDHLGFYLIGPQFRSDDRTLINMGMGVHDADHFREIGSPLADEAFVQGASEAERLCVNYFRELADAVLGPKSMEAFCRNELPPLPSPATAT